MSGVLIDKSPTYFSATFFSNGFCINPNLVIESSFAALIFSATEKFKTNPSSFLSSFRRAIPFPIASIGELIFISFPLRIKFPESILSAPKTALKSSVLPAPTRPAKLSTSPFFSSKLMLSSFPSIERFSILKTGSPPSGVLCGKA